MHFGGFPLSFIKLNLYLAYMLSPQQLELFWSEVDLIQQRHKFLFLEEHKSYIIIDQTDPIPAIKFEKDHQLPSNIILEITFAFKLALL